MILRIAAIVAGLGILAAATHAVVVHTGGYGTPHSIITMAIATGVAVGSITIGSVWSQRRRFLALLIAVALVSGELFGLIMTSNRLISASEEKQAPVRAALDARDRQQNRVKRLEIELRAIPETRVEAALKAQLAANENIKTQAALRGCRVNCRKLLQTAVDAASAEVTAARNELTELKLKAEAQLQAARVTFENMPVPASGTPLADRLGWQPWFLDLLTAALGSVAANGLAACLLIAGAHRKRDKPATPKTPATPSKEAMRFRTKNKHAKLKQMATPQLVSSNERPKLSPLQWCADTLHPQPGRKLELAEIYDAYKSDCIARDRRPTGVDDFFDVLDQFCNECEIDSLQTSDLVYLVDVELRKLLTAETG